jgi:hypothetical protein
MIGFSLLGAVLVVQATQPAPVVTISTAQIARAPHLTIGREPVWRIGGEAEGPYSFTFIVGATFMRGGGVAILEPRPPEVRVFDATGKHQFTFGRLGSGPGEFSQVQRLVPHAGDSLVISQVARVSVFDGSGKHARTMNTASASLGLSLVYRMFVGGSLLATMRPLPTPQDQARKREGVTRDSIHVVVLSANGAAVAQDLGTWPSGETVLARHDSGSTVTARAFSARLLLEGGDSLIFMLQAERPRIDVRRWVDGRKLRTIDFSLTPRAVTNRDIDEYAQSARAGARRGQAAAIAVRGTEAYLKIMTYPEHMPYFDALRWSYDHLVRLRRYAAPRDSTAQWLSLTPTGELHSVIDIPGKARVLDFDRDRVLIVERDADDLEYLALYKLIPSKR